MKTIWVLFRALPLGGKVFWVCMGGLPLLVGVLGNAYSLYWQLTPDDLHPAFAPDTPGATNNLVYGLAVTAVCAAFGYFQLRKRRAQERLVQVGQRIDPPVAKVEESLWQGRNGTRYYYIYSYWQDPTTGKRHKFESERLKFDASHYLRQGDSLPIYFMPGDPEHYYFDVSGLPKPKRFFWQ